MLSSRDTSALALTLRLSLRLYHSPYLSFPCISFKWLRIFLISAFFFGPGAVQALRGETITSSINFSLFSRLYWLESPGTRRYCASFWVYFTLHCQWVMGWPIGFMARLDSTRLVSARLVVQTVRRDAAQFSSFDSARFVCLLSCFFSLFFFVFISWRIFFYEPFHFTSFC